MRLLGEVHLKFLIFLFVLLESLLAFIKLVLLHDDVLTEQLCLVCLLVDLNLSHQDLT